MFPLPDISMVLPAVLDSGTRFARDHNRWCKEALREEAEHHHNVRIKKRHFRQSARHEYQHDPRKPRYLAVKAARYRSLTDLIKTRGTRKKFSAGWDTIRIGGKATQGRLHLTMRYRFPFPVSEKMPPSVNVTPKVMAREISTFSGREYGEIFSGFAKRYLGKLNRGLKPRVRKRILEKYPDIFKGL